MKTLNKEIKIVFKFNADQILDMIKNYISNRIKEFNVYSNGVVVNIEKITEEKLEINVYYSIELTED